MPKSSLPVSVENTKALLMELESLPEVKSIRDKAEAAREYAKQAGLGLDAQNECAEVKLWAERRAGELLRDMAERGERVKRQGGDRSCTMKLQDLGIDKNQSFRWQRIASVGESDFVEIITKARDSRREVTSASILAKAKEQEKALKRKAMDAAGCGDSSGVYSSLEPIFELGLKFPCIYADPPWKYQNQGTRAATNSHYDTLTVEELKQWPVEKIAADNAHLHLWTTNAFLPESFGLMEAWGFTYKSVFVWVKPQMGLGNYWRVSHEFLLLGVRGSLEFSGKRPKSWGEFNRTKHSEKPEAIRAMVENASPGPRIELFGRKQVGDWVVVGNQVEARLL